MIYGQKKNVRMCPTRHEADAADAAVVSGLNLVLWSTLNWTARRVGRGAAYASRWAGWGGNTRREITPQR